MRRYDRPYFRPPLRKEDAEIDSRTFQDYSSYNEYFDGRDKRGGGTGAALFAPRPDLESGSGRQYDRGAACMNREGLAQYPSAVTRDQHRGYGFCQSFVGRRRAATGEPSRISMMDAPATHPWIHLDVGVVFFGLDLLPERCGSRTAPAARPGSIAQQPRLEKPEFRAALAGC